MQPLQIIQDEEHEEESPTLNKLTIDKDTVGTENENESKMVLIKKDGSSSSSSSASSGGYLKVAVIGLTLVALIAGLSVTFLKSPSSSKASPSSPNVRSAPSSGGGGIDSSITITEGRLFEFELASLKDGSTGIVTVNTRPSWAPLGVEQFEKLIDSGFYDGCRFFRVVDNFVVQFGINGDPKVQKTWRKPIVDDPVATSNARGTMTFATSGPDTRTTQLFINTKRNSFLDKQGFAPFAQVVGGMGIVDMITSKYKEQPNQGKIQNRGNEYLEKEFPDLSYVKKVTEIQRPETN